MELAGARAWITGGARRVGRALAMGLARKGADIALHYHRSETDARSLAAEIEALGRRAVLVQADLSQPMQIASMAEQIGAHFGGLDILVNNASNYLRQPLMETDEAGWSASIDVNLRAPFFCAKAAVELMRMGGGTGKIVNIADSAALRPYPNHTPYMVSKAGLIAMTQALALELAPVIAVNAVAPGVVLMEEGVSAEEHARALAPVPLARMGSPEDVLRAVLFALECDYVTGQTIVVDGGRAIAAPFRR